MPLEALSQTSKARLRGPRSPAQRSASPGGEIFVAECSSRPFSRPPGGARGHSKQQFGLISYSHHSHLNIDCIYYYII